MRNRRQPSDVVPPLTPLEIAGGCAWTGSIARQLPEVPRTLTPVQALEDALRIVLIDPPCLVSFSGGRDSSALLAVATNLARREGLAPPIPATIRSASAENDENKWQERVIRHLGLREWHQIHITDELEILGEVGVSALQRRGVVYPFNSHFVPYCAHDTDARSLVVGLDGDGLLADYLWIPLAKLFQRNHRPTRIEMERVALASVPRRVRQEWAARRLDNSPMWLRESARRAFNSAMQRYGFSEPVTWPRRLAWYACDPCNSRTMASFIDDLPSGVRACAPLWDVRFLAVLAQDGGRFGYGDRTAAMRHIFGGLLPDALLARRSKAAFDELFWGPKTRDFARDWEGEGLDASLVDPVILKRCWETGVWPGASALAVQQAWLGTHG